jgi:hypothetical protein
MSSRTYLLFEFFKFILHITNIFLTSSQISTTVFYWVISHLIHTYLNFHIHLFSYTFTHLLYKSTQTLIFKLSMGLFDLIQMLLLFSHKLLMICNQFIQYWFFSSIHFLLFLKLNILCFSILLYKLNYVG